MRQARGQRTGRAWPSEVPSTAKEAADGHRLLGLQRSAGNAAVNRLIVQRADDDEAGPGGAPLAFDPDAIVADMASGAVWPRFGPGLGHTSVRPTVRRGEVHMPDDEQDEDRSTEEEGSEDRGINDPLTRTDVEALQKPFGSGPGSE